MSRVVWLFVKPTAWKIEEKKPGFAGGVAPRCSTVRFNPTSKSECDVEKDSPNSGFLKYLKIMSHEKASNITMSEVGMGRERS